MVKNRRTKEEYAAAAKDSISVAGVCKELGIIAAGGNYATVKKALQNYEIDTSHFKGQAHNLGNYNLEYPTGHSAIKARLIRERGHKCEWCSNSEWLEKPIKLELEHIDGNNSNNIEENLLLLCPNCHSTTPTWRRMKSSFSPNPNSLCPKCGGKKQSQSKHCFDCREHTKTRHPKVKQSKKPQNNCACGAVIHAKAKQCVACSHESQKRIVWPPRAEVEALVASSSFSAAGRVLGVSDNAVRKFLRKPVEPAAPTETIDEKKDEGPADGRG
jgi:hypothetical protein